MAVFYSAIDNTIYYCYNNMIRRTTAHLPDTKGFSMRDENKAAILELLYEELAQHYPRGKPEVRGTYGVFTASDHRFIKSAVSFVLGSPRYEAEFAFKPAEPNSRYDWVDQGRLAIIATFLLDYRDVFGLTPEMCDDAEHLKHHVRDELVPESVLRPAA